jgi:hypothetical protein
MQPGEVSFRSFQPPEWVSVRSFQPPELEFHQSYNLGDTNTIGGGGSSSSSSTQPVELPLLNLHPVVTVHPLQPSHTSEFQNVEPNNLVENVDRGDAERVLRGESTSMSVPQAFKEYTENWILSQTERRLITKKLWTRKKQTRHSKTMVFKSINIDNMTKFLDGSLKVYANNAKKCKYIDLSRRKNPMPLPTFILNPNEIVPHISSHTLNVGMVDYERLVRLYFIFLNYCFLTSNISFSFSILQPIRHQVYGLIKVFGTLHKVGSQVSLIYLSTTYRDVSSMSDDACTAFVEIHKLKIKKQAFVINVEASLEQSLALDIYCDQEIGDGTDSGITTDNLAHNKTLEKEYQCVMDLFATNLDILKAKYEYAQLFLRTRRQHGVTSKCALRHLTISRLHRNIKSKTKTKTRNIKIFQRSNLEKLLDRTNPTSVRDNNGSNAARPKHSNLLLVRSKCFGLAALLSLLSHTDIDQCRLVSKTMLGTIVPNIVVQYWTKKTEQLSLDNIIFKEIQELENQSCPEIRTSRFEIDNAHLSRTASLQKTLKKEQYRLEIWREYNEMLAQQEEAEKVLAENLNGVIYMSDYSPEAIVSQNDDQVVRCLVRVNYNQIIPPPNCSGKFLYEVLTLQCTLGVSLRESWERRNRGEGPNRTTDQDKYRDSTSLGNGHCNGVTIQKSILELESTGIKAKLDESYNEPDCLKPWIFEVPTKVSITALKLLQTGAAEYEKDRAKRAREARRATYPRRSRINIRETWRVKMKSVLIQLIKQCHRDGVEGRESIGNLRGIACVSSAPVSEILHDDRFFDVTQAAAVEDINAGHARNRYIVSSSVVGKAVSQKKTNTFPRFFFPFFISLVSIVQI